MGDYIGLTAMGIVCALGNDASTVWRRAQAGDVSGMKVLSGVLSDGQTTLFGSCDLNDDKFPSRVAHLIAAAVRDIRLDVEKLKEAYGADRIGLVVGTSNSTMEEYTKNPDRIDMATPALFLREHLKLSGPALSVSTACSSSVKVFATARKLLNSGVCDAVIAGGADSFSRVVVNGFDALEVVNRNLTTPMGEGREGINLGEGAAFFVLEKNRGAIALLGIGESSDAYHLTAPHPEGNGAEASMRSALIDASLEPEDIRYLNLHGTGTLQNDKMESMAVWRVFGDRPLCSSSKPMIGHALGAAGALETALCYLMLLNGDKVLPHPLNGNVDPELPKLRLAKFSDTFVPGPVLSNSFAFGGSNASIILGPARPSDILPHDPPMVLISSIDPSSITDESLSAFVEITKDSPFFDESIRGVSSVFALEYMAQTMAALVGLKRRNMRLDPRIGFVLGSRSIKTYVERFKDAERYRVDAKLDFTDGSFASFDVKITDSMGNVAAEGRINAFEPENKDVENFKEGVNK